VSTDGPRPDRLAPDAAPEERDGLAGKTCVVTGGSRGIGRAVAERLGSRGATVAVNYRSSATKASDVAEVIEAAGGEAEAVRADVTDPDDVATLHETVREAFGPVDVLVNNAGITRDSRFGDMTAREWRRVLDVNLTGAFNCTKAFYEDVQDADEGRVISVSSVVGKQGNFGQVNYAAAKAGLFGFTRTLALELAPTGSTANYVAPGFTRTDMLADVPESVQEGIREDVPLGRFADPEEVADAVAFLASDRSSYLTGEVLDVNGGIDL
jgi:3-oxoacyl-[acyl-carrier protein] reductase